MITYQFFEGLPLILRTGPFSCHTFVKFASGVRIAPSHWPPATTFRPRHLHTRCRLLWKWGRMRRHTFSISPTTLDYVRKPISCMCTNYKCVFTCTLFPGQLYFLMFKWQVRSQPDLRPTAMPGFIEFTQANSLDHFRNVRRKRRRSQLPTKCFL